MSTHDENEAATHLRQAEEDARIPLLNGSPFQRNSKPQSVSSLLQDWWLWELLSALVASLATTAIIVILLIYDSSPLPDFPSVFTVRHVYMRLNLCLAELDCS